MHESTLTPDEVLHWLALRLVPGLGSRKAGQLVERFGAPQAVFRASPSELQAAGLAGDVAHSVAGGCAFEEAVAQHEKLLAAGVELIPLGDSRYPRRLREIYDPPVVLFARGRVELLDTMMLGVVGTRRPTPYGVAVAERLSADLARAGLTIVSGMARGIDTAAHRGVLNAGGDTAAASTSCTLPKTAAWLTRSPAKACCCRSFRSARRRIPRTSPYATASSAE
jgi:DNA processing protein